MKRILILGFLALLIALVLISPVTASNPVKVLLNGLESPVDGLLIEDRTYVPLRWVSEQMGAFVEWKDGQVRISTTDHPIAKDLAANLKVLGAGEYLEVGGIRYRVDKVILETKNGKEYAAVTWIEEGNVNTEFGALPAFAYEVQGVDRPVKLVDYSVTVNPSFNNKTQRSLTYTFPVQGTLASVIYFPNGAKDLSAKPIGKWRTW